MSGVVYKQRFSELEKSERPKANVAHLRYIATRPGVIQNPGCGFGLWGRIGDEVQADDINNFKEASSRVWQASKDHTIYRAVISLDEETALQKGLKGREEWQELVTSRVESIAKANDIDSKDFRWCASYHQERGHPHVHIMFWDNSDRVHKDLMEPQRFDIAMESIRASFNGVIFKDELRAFRSEQDAAKKELRALSRNKIEGFEDLNFFDEDTSIEDNPDVRFYPKSLGEKNVEALSQRLEELIYLLPKTGQLKYQLLKPNVKEAVDAVSRMVLEQTSLKAAREKLLASAESISKTYGNSDPSIKRNIQRADREIFKDVGNDVLKVINSLDWLGQRKDTREDELRLMAHERMLGIADTVLNDKRQDSDFISEYQKFVNNLPAFLTPKDEVFKDPLVSDSLRTLALKCINDPRLKSETKVSQAFIGEPGKNADDLSAPEPTADNDKDKDNKEPKGTEEFKAVYEYISNQIYDMAAYDRGWDAQAQFLKVNSFLRAFCRMTSPRNSLNGASNRFLLLRELSRQAKKERALKMQDSSNMWQISY